MNKKLRGIVDGGKASKIKGSCCAPQSSAGKPKLNAEKKK